jgi:hypothetical protein
VKPSLEKKKKNLTNSQKYRVKHNGMKNMKNNKYYQGFAESKNVK